MPAINYIYSLSNSSSLTILLNFMFQMKTSDIGVQYIQNFYKNSKMEVEGGNNLKSAGFKFRVTAGRGFSGITDSKRPPWESQAPPSVTRSFLSEEIYMVPASRPECQESICWRSLQGPQNPKASGSSATKISAIPGQAC